MINGLKIPQLNYMFSIFLTQTPNFMSIKYNLFILFINLYFVYNFEVQKTLRFEHFIAEIIIVF